jgi:transcriptional regulator with XRE-family HTH domain
VHKVNRVLGNTPSQIGALIRELRKQSGMTQKDLSRVTRCSAKFIGEVENGKVSAEIGKVLRLALRLNCNIYFEWADKDGSNVAN